MKECKPNSLPLSMGNARKPLRITVVKTLSMNDIYGGTPDGVLESAEKTPAMFRVGDVFTVTDKGGKPPADFPCPWAWHDIFQDVLTLQLGGNFPGFEDGICYVCTTKGLHPVFFKLERLD